MIKITVSSCEMKNPETMNLVNTSVMPCGETELTQSVQDMHFFHILKVDFAIKTVDLFYRVKLALPISTSSILRFPVQFDLT